MACMANHNSSRINASIGRPGRENTRLSDPTGLALAQRIGARRSLGSDSGNTIRP